MLESMPELVVLVAVLRTAADAREKRFETVCASAARVREGPVEAAAGLQRGQVSRAWLTSSASPRRASAWMLR